MPLDRTIRLSQTVAPFGVGAIYDIRGESLTAADTRRWGGIGDRVVLQRLADDLGVKGFRSAPARWREFSTGGPRLPFVRFPRWLFCPVCRHMTHWKTDMEQPGEPARCPRCDRTPKPQLVPMRFVMTCKDGHLGDVQWDRWAHSRAETAEQKQCASRHLRFETKPNAGTGLDALIVACDTCGASRSLQGIGGRGAARTANLLCPGKQPWEYLPAGAPQCKNEPIVLQRGASNLYFADVRSAIDIPPESNFDVFSDVASLVTHTPEFELLRSSNDEFMADMLVQRLADQFGVPAQQIRGLAAGAAAEVAGTPGSSPASTGDLRRDEWNALANERGEQDERDRFLTEHERLLEDPEAASGAELLLAGRFDRVVLVTRLREVRALTGFRRYDTGGKKVPPDLDGTVDWLPALEVFGEGLFLPFDEGPLQEWEQRSEVIDRVRLLEQRRPGSLIGNRVKIASPRFVLLHTFAHMLIRRLAFEAGYAAASLRERVYCAEAGGDEPPYAGVLVYTAAGDAEGTLGGLVRQGRPPRMLNTLMSLLEDAAWCSSDPLCVESTGQGFQALNRGACHACALVAETSCEYANGFLDRATLIGAGRVGFFSDVLETALQASGEVAMER
jgi:hypothetical protein